MHSLALHVQPAPNHVVRHVRELTESEYDAYRHAYRTLVLFFRQRPFVLTQRMYRRFIEIVSTHEARLVQGASDDHLEPKVDLYFEINSHLALWLEACRLFLNQTETRLKRTYGANSPEWATWAAAKSSIFDQEVPYRFMYHLRNYLHEEMPATAIGITSREVSPGVVESVLWVGFSREDLLKSPKWHAKVRADIQAMPPEFPLLPLAARFNESIQDLLRALYNLELPRVQAAASLIDDLASEALAVRLPRDTEDARPVICSFEPREDGGPPREIVYERLPVAWLPLVSQALTGEITVFDVDDAG